MPKFRLYDYDLVGNDKDGFEVNDRHKGELYDIPEDVVNDLWGRDKPLIQWLKKQGVMKKTVKDSKVEIGGDDEIMYFNYLGRPEFELVKEED